MVAMAIYGYRISAIIFACDFVVSHIQYDLGFLGSFIIAASTTIECGIFFFCHEQLKQRFSGLEVRVYFLYFVSIVIAVFVGALLGTGLLGYFGDSLGKEFLDELGSWWIGDVFGALTVVTLALCFLYKDLDDRFLEYFSRRNLVVAFYIAALITFLLSFPALNYQFNFVNIPKKFTVLEFGFGFIIIVPMLYATISFGPKMVALLVAYLNTCESMVLFLGRKFGSLGFEFSRFDLVDIQLSLISLNLITMIIGIAIWRERQALGAAHRAYSDLLQVSRRNTADGVAATLAHEISQPISAIGGLAEGCINRLSQNHASNSDIRDALRKIATYVEQVGETINRLRTFLHPGAVAKARFDINTCLQEAVTLFATDASKQGATIDLALVEPPPVVLADRVQITQVLANLIRNAIDAVAERESGIRKVVVRSTMVSENCVEVAVEDTGKGLPRWIGDRVFDPYFTTKPDGLGMGLAISRSIIQNHGGRLRAENRTDQGASFRFTLPVAGVEADDSH